MSLRGTFTIASIVPEGLAAFAVCEPPAVTSSEVAVKSGLVWIMRIVPPTEPEPYSVPCGPRSTSTRSMSVSFRFANSGVSST